MSFFDDVYRLVKEIPEGKVTTYGQLASFLGTKDARKVGWALHANKDQNTPCHRVVSKNGRLAKNFAFGGEKEQRRRLEVEGASFVATNHVDLKKHLWKK